MGKYNEQQLYQIWGAGMGRLRPDGLSAFLVVALIISGFLTLIPFFGNQSNSFQVPWITAITWIWLILWVLQAMITLFFLSIDRAYKYQKLQVQLVNMILIKLTVDGYIGFLVDVKEKNSIILNFGLVYLLAGILFLIWSIQNGKRNVERGELAKDGHGIYYTGHNKWWLITPIAMFIVLLIILTVFSQTGVGNGWFLVFSVSIQLVFSFAYPEFHLLGYARKNLPSFIVKNRYKTKKGKEKN